MNLEANNAAAVKRARATAAKKPNATQRKLAAMLKENTGTHFLDSGGAYGRAWQRNQARDFMNEESTVLAKVADYVEDGRDYEPEVTHNVFHFLAEALDFDASMNRRYQAFARSRRKDSYEVQICEDFMDYLREKGHELGGIYGEGKPFTVNTYNGEDLVSQTLQYLYFSCDGDEYCLLQIHGGADVRGGYTDAVAFRSGLDVSPSITDNARATIYTLDPAPEEEEQTGDLFGRPKRGLWERPFWSSDDGYHWYRDGSSDGKSLKDYPISRDPENRGKGTHVYVDADGNPHCPESGLRLAAGY